LIHFIYKAPAKASPAKKATAEEKELDELLSWAS